MKTKRTNPLISRLLTFLCLVAGVALTGCTSAPAPAAPPTPSAISLVDGLGNRITLQHPAERVVSIAPSNTEILFAIGAQAQLVGRDSFSDYPAEAKTITDVGGQLAAPNMEVILSQKPDLVLAAPITPSEQIADLQKVGLTVYVVPNPKTFDELYANLQTVGQLTGHETEASALIASLKGRVEAVTQTVAKSAQKPVVYYELDATDPSAPYTSGPSTFVDLIIQDAGGKNFGANLSGEWVQISVEQLLAQQPDVILLGDNTYGGVTSEQVAARAGWDTLNAVKLQKIFTFDDNLVSRPGPRLVDGLEAMAKLLHPDLFK